MAPLSGPHKVFLSFRFSEAEAEAKALQAALQARGVKTFVSNTTAGADLQDVIAEALGESKVHGRHPAAR